MRGKLVAAWVVPAVVLSGCLIGTTPIVRTFLPSVPQMDTASPIQLDIAIRLTRVEIPGYLDHPEIALRREGVEMVYDPFAHWAQPLDLACTREIARVLRQVIPGASVHAYPEPAGHEDAVVQIQFDCFEATDQGEVVARARWTLRQTQPLARTVTGRFDTSEKADPGDKADIAAAHGRILGRLGVAVAEALATTTGA